MAVESSGQTVAIKALLLTDLVDSTKLVHKLGDARAAEVSDQHDALARELLAACNGKEIDKTDGFLFLFERPADAVRYTLGYHKALADLGEQLGVSLSARAGIHLGEVVLRENPAKAVALGAKPLEVEGIAKPTAARVMSLAQGRQTLMTKAAFDLARRAFVGRKDHDEVAWVEHGLYRFKGVEEPLEISEVGIKAFSYLKPPPDSDKAWSARAWRPDQGLEIPRRPGWVLKEKLGEGAYGEVWVARKGDSGPRRVFKFCLDPQNLKALKHEVRFLNILKEKLGDREDIGRIIDWQLDESPYFLESEFAEGGSLSMWAEQQGGLAKVPLEVRLDVVAQVADVLGAAHSIGVLHKDVKPGNVLVRTDKSGRPRVRLIDFGIGALLDSAATDDLGGNVTESMMVSKQMVKRVLERGSDRSGTDRSSSSGSGTAVYMAPELLEGTGASIQSDIYSLGIVFYQLAAGSFKVLAPGWERDVPDEVLREDVARCVDGNPRHRFGSAIEVAERIRTLDRRRAERQALLEAEEQADRLRILQEEQGKRRRTTVIVSSVALLFFVTISAFAWQASQRAKEAETARQHAEELTSFMLFDLYGALRPLNRISLLRKVANEANVYYKTLPPSAQSDAAMRKRAVALANIGEVLQEGGLLDAAIENYQQAHTILSGIAARAAGDADVQAELGRTQLLIGKGHRDKADTEKAMASFRESLATFEKLRAKESASIPIALGATEALDAAGNVELERGDAKAALASFEKATTLLEPLSKDSPDVRFAIADNQRSAGAAKLQLGDAAEGLAAMTTALRGLEELTNLDPSNSIWERSLGACWSEVGRAREQLGDLEGQSEAYSRALTRRIALARQDPRNPSLKVDLAESHDNAGYTLMMMGDIPASLAAHTEALRLRKELVQMDPKNVSWQHDLATTHQSIGQALLEQGSHQASLEAFRTGRELLEAIGKSSSNDTLPLEIASVDVAIGEVTAEMGSPAPGLELIESGVAVLEKRAAAFPDNAEDQAELASALLIRGNVRSGQGKPEAKVDLERALALAGSMLKDPPDIRLLDTKVQALLLLDRIDEARPLALQLLQKKWNEPNFLELCRKKGIK